MGMALGLLVLRARLVQLAPLGRQAPQVLRQRLPLAQRRLAQRAAAQRLRIAAPPVRRCLTLLFQPDLLVPLALPGLLVLRVLLVLRAPPARLVLLDPLALPDLLVALALPDLLARLDLPVKRDLAIPP